MQKIIVIILSILLSVSLTCNAIFSHRLEQNRQQLEYVRMELERSRDNYKFITDGLTRTAEILSQSAGSVQELRKQISKVRENYEAMEVYINNTIQ